MPVPSHPCLWSPIHPFLGNIPPPNLVSHSNYLSLPLTVELSESSGQLLLGLSCCVVRWLESHEGLSGLDVQDGTLT